MNVFTVLVQESLPHCTAWKTLLCKRKGKFCNITSADLWLQWQKKQVISRTACGAWSRGLLLIICDGGTGVDMHTIAEHSPIQSFLSVLTDSHYLVFSGVIHSTSWRRIFTLKHLWPWRHPKPCYTTCAQSNPPKVFLICRCSHSAACSSSTDALQG